MVDDAAPTFRNTLRNIIAHHGAAPQCSEPTDADIVALLISAKADGIIPGSAVNLPEGQTDG